MAAGWLDVVPAGSRCSWHRLVLLHGPFLAVLGQGDLFRSWIERQRSTCRRRALDRKRAAGGWFRYQDGYESEDGGEDGDGDETWRYLHVPGRRSGSSSAAGGPVSVVVECKRAKDAAELCAAAADAAAADPGGCLRVARLAGSSLEEAVFGACVSPVGSCGAWGSGKMTP